MSMINSSSNQSSMIQSLAETARALVQSSENTTGVSDEQGSERSMLDLPFALYSSVGEQHLVNIPIIKPVMVCVLEGTKQLGTSLEVNCTAGEFVFIANDPSVTMRNIPLATSYLALLIEFEFEDFAELNRLRGLEPGADTASLTNGLLVGEMDQSLLATLQQFIEWSVMVPRLLWASRRREILQLLYHQGHVQLAGVVESANLRHRLHSLISRDLTAEWSAAELASRVAMGESTLRRKLQAEGTSIQAIKDGARLGQGLHLVQSSFEPIGLIAERCGYQSQSRFTDKFKQLFGMTPTDLRRTREQSPHNISQLSESGEILPDQALTSKTLPL